MAGTVMPADVLQTVEAIMARPWAWGQADCCTGPCDVFRAMHGIDPMAPLRGAYTTAAGAAKAIKSYGGYVVMAEALAAAAGLAAIRDGVPGAIGMSHKGAAVGLGGRCLLICIEPGIWAAKIERGFGTIDKAERVWRAP